MLWVTCHLLIGQCGHVLFLHVSGPYWTTCHVRVVPLVRFLLAHVSCCSWSTCHFLIGPCVIFLLVHVATISHVSSFFYSTTCHDVVRPHVSFLVDHMSCPKLPMRIIFIRPHGRTDLYHVLDLNWLTCPILALTRVIH
jgi:hypothetical protein